jgi:selenocysteine-specific elongation factor
METKHLIMGTAGHVDHGKTALIRALTGFDCDTHKQEKERGITINLGFTHLDLPQGNSIGIIDVPGHADFIKTMISGACGMDFVLLIIAADEGIMPQTREHLEIMKLMGIKQGLIALTKVDTVDEELTELAMEEARDFVADSFLADADIFPVSALKDHGIAELIHAIEAMVQAIPAKSDSGNFRMYIDRQFVQPGFGVIVNGSVLSGAISSNDPVYLLPSQRELRIRRMERHGAEVTRIQAGDRASINLVGLKQKDFKRGMMLSSHPLDPTRLVDGRLSIFAPDIQLGLWSQVLFLSGTIRCMARMHLLDRDTVQAGEQALVQIYLPEDVVVQSDDHFILRNSSGDTTIGGGQIVDPYPLHHRRRRKGSIEEVSNMASGQLGMRIAAEVKKHIIPLTHREIATNLNLVADEIIPSIFNELPDYVVFFQHKDDIVLLEKKRATAWQNKILALLEKHHKENPFIKEGKSFNELMGIFPDAKAAPYKLALTVILEHLRSHDKIAQVDTTWILAGHTVSTDETFLKQIGDIEAYVQKNNGLYSLKELTETFQDTIKPSRLKQMLSYLVEQNNLVLFQLQYVHRDTLQKAQELITKYLLDKPEGITIAEFRDAMATNRTTALFLLEWFDKQNVTLRNDNVRILTKRYRDSLDL